MPTPVLVCRDGHYYAHWSENRRSKRKSMGTKDRALAESRFAEWLLIGGHRDLSDLAEKPKMTISELWTVYDQKHVETVAAPQTIRYCWRNLEHQFGKLHPSDVEQDLIDDYVEKRREGRIGLAAAPGTIRRELVSMRAMMNWHASRERGKNRLLESADVPRFKLPADSEPRDRWLTGAEITRLFGSFDPEGRMSRAERFLWLALETAARKQAILELTWDRVDFETGMIHYAKPGARKTKKRRVSVPISNKLLPVLERMYAERKSEFVLDSASEIWDAVQAVVVRAGLVKERVGKKGTGISPHTFRHTAATHMARRGVPLHTIAGVLGNTLAMVERVYAKHQPGALRNAVNLISSEGVFA